MIKGVARRKIYELAITENDTELLCPLLSVWYTGSLLRAIRLLEGGMGKAVAVGGGPFDAIDPLLQTIFDLCGPSSERRVTVIPTAAGSADGEVASFRLWRGKLRDYTSSVEPLYLLGRESARASRPLAETDAAWVPGGNARLLLSTWRRVGMDRELRQAFRRGVILSGRSAGANCWFSYSLGAEPPRKTARFFSYRRNKGLRLIKTTLCTRYQDRREPFRHLLHTFGCTGIGLEDGAAFVCDDDEFKVVSSGSGTAHAASVSEETAFLVEKPLAADGRLRPLHGLGLWAASG